MWSKWSFLRWMRKAGTGSALRRPALRFESLETRDLPATYSALSPAVLEAAQQSLAGPLNRAGYDLALLAADYQSFSSASLASPYQSSNTLLQVSNGSVVVDVLPAADIGALQADLASVGFQPIAAAPYVLSGWLPISALGSAASLASVRAIQASYRPITSVGVVDSQGPRAQQSDKVVNFLGFDGTGVTVGVISDSYNSLGGASSDVGTGDLPGAGNPFNRTQPVNVIDDSLGGSDEGRAVLQIVHDTAPGANLAFATGGLTQTQFRNNIIGLANSGVNVIVDDFHFLAEPMFMDGIVAQAVDTVVALNISYFSAAGNNGRASYQQAYRNSGVDLVGTGSYSVPAALSPTFIAHDFDPGAGADFFQTLTLPAGITHFSFQWADRFFSVGGLGAQTNMNLAVFDMNGQFLATSGGFTQNVGGDAVEVFSFNNTSGSPIQIQFAIGKESGPDPSVLKYVAFQPAGQSSFSVDEYATNSSTIYGHANAAGASAIGAALYSETPPYGVSPPQLQEYSSRGGTPILFVNSVPLPMPQLRQSPDLVGPDGVNTTFFGQADPIGGGGFEADGHPNFFGTSAAAPHVAGVAAILLQVRPSFTPHQSYSTLETTAIDMGDPGYDTSSGWGLVNATAAVLSLNAGPYLVTFDGTTGGDAMVVRRDTGGSRIEFLIGTAVQFSIPASQVASIQVNGREGGDSLTIDSRNGAIARAVSFDGGTGSDSFFVLGTQDLPNEINAFSDVAPIPTITFTSGTSPRFAIKDVEGAVLEPTNGVVNLLGDNDVSPQNDTFVVTGTGLKSFTAALNSGPAIQFVDADTLNVYGRFQTDVLTVSPWASNAPSGWGVQTFFDGGNSTEGDLLAYHSVAANPVSENIAIQPAGPNAGEIRVVNASDSSAVAIISYANAELAVNDTDGFATDTDTLELRGTNAAETFVVDLTAAGTFGFPMVDVRLSLTSSLYRLRSFAGFDTLGLVGYGGSDTVDVLAGRNDGAVSLDVDLGLPAGGPLLADRDRIQLHGTMNAGDTFHFTPGQTNSSGLVTVARAAASAATAIDFRNVEVVAFDGKGGSTVGDTIVMSGTTANDNFELVAITTFTATAHVNGGPLVELAGLVSAATTISMHGLDGADTFAFTSLPLWSVGALAVDGGTGGGDTVTITGTPADDRFTYTASTGLLTLESPEGQRPLPISLAGLESILIDGITHDAGDRLVLTEPISWSPTANAGTVPTNPPLQYRNIEYFVADQLPAAGDDFASTLEDVPVLVSVLDNDTGLGDGPIVITIAAPPSFGTAVVIGNLIRYTPSQDYNDFASGSDSFTYQVADANGDLATALVTISISPVNDTPIANGQSHTALEDGDTIFFLTGSDGDPEANQTLTFAIATGPQHGTILEFNPATGRVLYRAAPNYAGPDSFTFTITDDATAGGAARTSAPATITLAVLGANDPPTAFAQSHTINEDTGFSFTLVGADGDSEVNQTLTFTIVAQPLQGTITSFNASTGKGTYVPALNYHGSDEFLFTVTDDTTAGGPAQTSAPVAVAFTIVAVNDPPVALPQSLDLAEEGSLAITLTADDGDPETAQTLTFSLVSIPLHGTLSGFNPATGQVLYTPNPNYAGIDLFTFLVTDDGTAGGPPRTSGSFGTITLTVLGSNDRPVALPQTIPSAEDIPVNGTLTADDGDAEVTQAILFTIVTGPQHGAITNFDQTTGAFTYTPHPNFNGTDSFTFVATDDATAGGPDQTSLPGTITITVAAVNDQPTAASQSVSVVGNKSLVISLAADDGDPELNQTLTYAIVGGPAHGTLTPLGGGQFLYRPTPAFVGADSFTFTATDNGSPAMTSAVATIDIDVTRPPDGVYVVGAGEGGGSHVKVYNARTGVERASFFAYGPDFTGGVRVAAGDVNGDGVLDIITGAGVGGFPHVKVFSGTDFSEIVSVFAFDLAFEGGISVASGDVDGLPGDEIVVGAGSGGGPHVRTFKWVNGTLEQLGGPLGSFFAYADEFAGGVNVAVGNFDGMPGDEIITGAGMFGGPHVKVFSAGGLVASFFAFPDDGRLGVTVAAGDVDGDGKAEILTGSGVGGGPIPRLFEGGTAILRDEFAAFDEDYRGGITVGTTDEDGDGLADLLIAPGQVARSLQIFDGESISLLDEFDAYDSDFLGGVYVAGK